MTVAAVLLGFASCAGTAEAPLPATLKELPPSKTPPKSWPASAEDLERRLASENFEVRKVEGAGAGTTGALKLELFFPQHNDTILFKWKPVPAGDAEGFNNAPRKEVACYQIQPWFLDPTEYVVPTTALHCFPPEMLEAHGVRARANMPGARCVLGMLAVWVDPVTVPDHVLQPERFASDPEYATRMGRFNLFTYLVEHEDGRSGNFLVSKPPDEFRIFAIDNGIAFGAFIQNWFVPNWNVIRIPAVPHLEIERLRRVDRSLIDRLGVVAELKADANGILRPVPPGPNRDPKKGTRVTDGWVQLGLTRKELDRVEARLHDLLARVDRGELRTF
jgi:hypothetical protein